MQMILRFLPLLACGQLLGAAITTTVTADWTGTGTTNGWTFGELGTPYRTDGAPVAIQFSKGGAYVTSPVVDGELVRTELALRSSKTPQRALAVIPLRDGKPVGAPVYPDPPNADRPVSRTIAFSRALHANGLRIELGTGLSGNWGLYSVALTTMAEDEVTVPYDLANRKTVSHRLNATWRTGDETAACEFRAYVTNAIPFSARYAEFHGFDTVTNTARQSRDVSALFPMSEGKLDGERLYAPAESVGEITLGSSDVAGVLRYRPQRVSPDDRLILRARRYPSRDEGNAMPLGWTRGAETNALDTLVLSDAYADYVVALGSVPDGATLLLHSSTNRATASGANGRVIVDSVALASEFVRGRTETNELLRVRVNGTSVSVTGLQPGTCGRWTVRAFDARGNASALAPSVPFATDPTPRTGTQIRLK